MLARALKTLAALGAATCLTVSSVEASPIALDGSWIVMADEMSEGDFFTGTGTGSTTLAGATSFDWTSLMPVLFRITDLFVVSDTFRVFDNGVALFDVVNGSDWQLIPGCFGTQDASCHWSAVADDAWLDPLFAKASYVFAPGDHSIVVQSLSIPVHVSGVDYGDGTVAISATELVPVPEPGSMLLLGSGLASVAYRVRKRRSASAS